MPPTPPVIFLDVDGVLNVSARIAMPRPAMSRRNGSTYAPPPLWRSVWHFNQGAVSALDRLIAETGAMLVLSSTWRRHDDAQARLSAHGVNGPWHSNWRTDAEPGGRGAQIARWLIVNGSPDYLVLDDRAAELGGHAAQLVLTAFRIGLTRDDAARASALLRATRGGL